jgi:TatD DNase family protein
VTAPALFDTHCHLDEGSFPEGADAVIARARDVGVRHFTCIGVGSLEHARFALALAERRSDVVATAGVHPHDASAYDDVYERELEALGSSERVVAIGEMGLDYHYDHSPRELQAAVFRREIALARKLGKPIVVHTRSAPEDTLAILAEEGASQVGGIIHCFSEDVSFARRALDLGFYLSFSGIVTFKRAEAVHEAARFAPLDRVLVETDSPYLAPVPLRGRKCEPSHIVHTAARLSELRGEPLEAVARATSDNAFRVFRLDPGAASA